MGENAFEKSIHSVKLAPGVMDLVDIMAERNRRKGRGSTTRAEVIRDAVNLLLEHTARATRRHSNAATAEVQDVRS